MTVAIVDAFDATNAEADLAVFSAQFGLPSCTTANGCFKKVSQTGTSTLPAYNSGWEGEISLDVQWVHASAPNAHILLVEAKSDSTSDLLIAVNYAKANASRGFHELGRQRIARRHRVRQFVFANRRDVPRIFGRHRRRSRMAVLVP